jgi:hypothetical protein
MHMMDLVLAVTVGWGTFEVADVIGLWVLHAGESLMRR